MQVLRSSYTKLYVANKLQHVQCSIALKYLLKILSCSQHACIHKMLFLVRSYVANPFVVTVCPVDPQKPPKPPT